MQIIIIISIPAKALVRDAQKFSRETIFIFQSDNGGATHKFRGKREAVQRACNYPYKGYKNTLYEGGTISPAFIYSTKRTFARKRVNDVLHIIDWFPTIMDLAGFNVSALTHIDGVSQKNVLQKKYYTPPRRNFIYGVLNEFVSESKGENAKVYSG